MSLLLDTNVVSELRRRRPHPGVTAWYALARSSDLRLSVMVIGELRIGVERLARRDKEQAVRHEEWLADLLDLFEDRIVPVTVEIAEAWGRMAVPDPVPIVDGLLAATALVHDWTLVTRNVTDMQRTGVRLLNPFEPETSVPGR